MVVLNLHTGKVKIIIIQMGESRGAQREVRILYFVHSRKMMTLINC